MTETEKNTREDQGGYHFLMDREPTDKELEAITRTMGEQVRAETAALEQKLEEDLSCLNAPGC